jgi:hypothetical protein
MRKITIVGACWMALVAAAPATAGDPAAQPAPTSSQTANGAAPSAAGGHMLIMTLSTPKAEPQPRTADPRDLSKHILAARPAKPSS